MDGTEIRLTCGSLAKTSKLIRSLRDDEQVKSQEPWMRKWLRVHDESERSLITLLILRRSFLEANLPVVVSLIGPFVVPINKMQMKPRLMMAALTIRSQGIENAPCLLTFQER